MGFSSFTMQNPKGGPVTVVRREVGEKSALPRERSTRRAVLCADLGDDVLKALESVDLSHLDPDLDKLIR